jgi:hypothetical protein
MSCDKLVFDLSQEVEGSPNVFIRKDWINILDNQNQNYQNNQSIIDTSQLSNSNKYMGYREAYLSIPLTLTLLAPAVAGNTIDLAPVAGVGVADYSIGLKNWYGTIIHSFTLDYNGTTIIQQTPFCNMWNSFKLMTTLSYNDILTQGSTIGFYPDTPGSWLYVDANATYNAGGVPTNQGRWVCNNDLAHNQDEISSFVSSVSTNFLPANGGVGGNFGLTKRISYINYNPNVVPNGNALNPTYAQVGITSGSSNQVWKSYIYNQINSVAGAGAASGIMQIAVMATVYLKHIHSFFNMVPLLKGTFMKMTMNLNNSTTTITLNAAGAVTDYIANTFVGGVNPLLIPSARTGSASSWEAGQARNVIYNLSVGAVVTDASVTALAVTNLPQPAPLSKSIYLYVPAYTFNHPFEKAYLSVSPKIIKYTDIYQYQILGISGAADSGQFNNLVTNGIANIKSVLIIPFYASTTNTVGGVGSYAEFLSPFDPAGCGSTAPMVTLGNFNIQISGQNAIYNMQRYGFEEFNNQLYGQFAVNGGLTDGLTSGLIDFDAFQKTASYYYVNVERMLPVEQSVPKSVQILGTNYSTKPLNLWVFIEYGVQVQIDILTGARV